MKNEKTDKVNIRLYEYPLYWLVTFFVLMLAIPLLTGKFIAYLVRSMGTPFKSVKSLIGLVIVLVLAAAAITAYEVFLPYDIGSETKSVTVYEKDSFHNLLESLKNKGIIKGPYLFKKIAVLLNVDKSLAPGRYDFAGKLSMYDILKKLKNRDIATVLITIPEGQTAGKTASVFAGKLGLDSAAFVARVFDTAFVKSRYGVSNLEGYLFPETYRVWYGIKIDEIIDILYNQFSEQTGDLLASLSDKSLSSYDFITLASIIEAEATDGSEMPVISSVYHNRLNRKMKLQADPTVIYALGGLDRPVWYRDLKFDSPYNTYKYKGLPPGPINSPGLGAIKAAAFPEATEYLYFVADGEGRHIFSQTLREHNRAKGRIKNTKRNK